MQIRCNFPDISYLSETQKNNFQFLNNSMTITVNKWWLCNYLGPTYELPERNYPECASPLTLVRTEKVSIRLNYSF